MATQQVDGNAVTATSTNNDNGSVLNGGSTTVLNSVDLGYSNVGVFGSSVVDGTDADKSIDAGTFSYNNQKPIAKRITEELAGGVSNTFLQSGASKPELTRSIHKLEVLTTRRLTTAIRAGKWNIFKGAFLNNQNQSADNPVVATDTLASDNAATPTRAVPGELVYKTSAPVPVQDDYKAKTN
jgi:hypothetical protein